MARPEGAVLPQRLRLRHAAAVAGALAFASLLVVSTVFFHVGWSGRPTLTPRFGLGEFLAGLSAQVHWLAPFAALSAALPALRALVWRAVLPRPVPRYAETYHATALGALVHNTVPGKLGPLAAAWALVTISRRPFAAAFSSQLVSKLLELGAIVTFGALAAALRGRADVLRRVVLAGGAVFAALSVLALALAFGAPRAAARIARRLPRAGAALAGLGEGIAGAGRPARLAAGIALAALPALDAALAYTLPLHALGLGDGMAGGALLVSVIAFGQLTPGLPIGTGVYWSLAAWAARQLGAPPEDAAAIAILTHAGTLGAGLAVGAASAIARRSVLPELFRRRTRAPT